MTRLIRSLIMHGASMMPDGLRVQVARSPIAPLLRSAFGHKPYVGAVEIIAGPARGLRIITDLATHRAYIVGTYEPENLAAIKQVCRSGMTAVDIGAHEGYLTLVMATLVGNTGRVIAFEPLPQNFERLSQTIALNDLHHIALYQMALSDGTNARAWFHANAQSSSMGKLIENGQIADTALEINVSSLDQVAGTSKITSIDFVKIDVEGHDLEVLNGMREVIDRFAPSILIEFHSEELFESGYAFLSDRGYQMQVIDPRVHAVLAIK